MNKQYKVMIRQRGGWKLYQICQSQEDAQFLMNRLNIKNLNKAYKRAKSRGRANLSSEQYASTLGRVAIQY